MADLFGQVSNALSVVGNLVEGGKVNLSVNNPVVQISGKEAIAAAQPYIIAFLALNLTLGLLFIMAKRGTI